MKHTYLLCAKIRIDGIFYECYYTVEDYWVMNKNLPIVEYFQTLEDAEQRLDSIVRLLKSKMCSSKLSKIYIKNSKDKIIKVLYEEGSI